LEFWADSPAGAESVALSASACLAVWRGSGLEVPEADCDDVPHARVQGDAPGIERIEPALQPMQTLAHGRFAAAARRRTPCLNKTRAPHGREFCINIRWQQ